MTGEENRSRAAQAIECAGRTGSERRRGWLAPCSCSGETGTVLLQERCDEGGGGDAQSSMPASAWPAESLLNIWASRWVGARSPEGLEAWRRCFLWRQFRESPIENSRSKSARD